MDDVAPTRSRRRMMLGVAATGALLALCAAAILKFRVDIERHSDLVEKVQEVGGVSSSSDDELVRAVGRLDEERRQATTDLTAERAARAQADASATEAASARDAAQAKADALGAIFPLTVEALRAADFTNPTLTAIATPVDGGCSGLLQTPVIADAGCSVSYVGFTRAFSLTNDGTNWHLAAEGYADIVLVVDPATGTLSGAAPIVLGWPCFDGTTGANGSVSVSLTPDSWAPGDPPPTLHAVRFQGAISEDGNADGACAFSGMRWTATYAP